jgi:hypothetical protein
VLAYRDGQPMDDPAGCLCLSQRDGSSAVCGPPAGLGFPLQSLCGGALRADTRRVSTTDPFADGGVVDRLHALRDHYVDAVNRAVAEDRYDLVAELVADYPDEALAVIVPCPGDPC